MYPAFLYTEKRASEKSFWYNHLYNHSKNTFMREVFSMCTHTSNMQGKEKQKELKTVVQWFSSVCFHMFMKAGADGNASPWTSGGGTSLRNIY